MDHETYPGMDWTGQRSTPSQALHYGWEIPVGLRIWTSEILCFAPLFFLLTLGPISLLFTLLFFAEQATNSLKLHCLLTRKKKLSVF